MSEFTHLRTAKLSVVTDRHLLDLKLRNFSPRTIDSYTGTFKHFNDWCGQRGITIAGELTEEAISGYRRYLYHRISEATGKPLSFNTQSHKLHTIRCFCRWAFQNKIVDADPSTRLVIPNAKNRQLANVLTGDEMAALLNAPDLIHAAWPAQPRDHRDVLLNGDSGHRTEQPGAERCGRRPDAGSCPARKRRQRSASSDRHEHVGMD